MSWLTGLLLGLCSTNSGAHQVAQAEAVVHREQKSALSVVCSLGILGDLAKQVGGELVTIEVLSSSRQDPHFVEPRPTLMRKARKADVFIQVGLQLELWAEKVITGSGNPAIQNGQAGYVVASAGVSTLELPSVLSREWGDVHPNGNPHIWLDPINAKLMAANIASAFSRLDAGHADQYASNLADFERRIDEALFGPELLKQFGSSTLTRMARSGKLASFLELRSAAPALGGWLKRAEPLKGKQFVSYHKTFVYFAHRFGMNVPIEVEAKPGIPPTPKHKAAVLEVLQQQNVVALMQAQYFDRNASEYLCQASGAQLCVVPIDVELGGRAQDIFGLIELLLDELLEAQTQAGR